VTYPALKGGASGGVWPFLNGITVYLHIHHLRREKLLKKSCY